MSSSVFLAPCDPGNFDRTVQSEVDLSEYPDHPEEFSDEEIVRFWGVREGPNNRNYFEKMEQGDLVLFYQNGEYIGTGWVGTKFEDEEEWVSSTFWRNAPSKLIYTIQEFTSVSVPRSAVNRIFGYSGDYYPQGLMRVAPDRVNRRPVVIKRALEQYTENHG